MEKYVFKSMLVGFIISFLLGIFFTAERISFMQKAIRAEGAVIEIIKELHHFKGGRRTFSHDSYLYYPRIEYTAPNGQKAQFISSSGFRQPRYNVLDKVTVLYVYENGRFGNAAIDSFQSLWLAPLAFLFIGLSGGFVITIILRLIAKRG